MARSSDQAILTYRRFFLIFALGIVFGWETNYLARQYLGSHFDAGVVQCNL